MDMPSPNEHHRKLAKFAGTWIGTETMHPSEWLPAGGSCEAKTVWRMDLSNLVMITDYQQLKDGHVTYGGHGVYTIDPQSNEVVLHWFDAMAGQREEFRGNWDGDVLTMLSKNAMGSFRIRYDLSVDGKLQVKGEMSPDGEAWKPMFDGEHARQ